MGYTSIQYADSTRRRLETIPTISKDVWEKIGEAMLEQVDWAINNGDDHIVIYIGEVSDQVPEMQKFINENMDDDSANCLLLRFADLILYLVEEIYGDKYNVDAYAQYWERGEDEGKYDLYDGGFVGVEFERR